MITKLINNQDNQFPWREDSWKMGVQYWLKYGECIIPKEKGVPEWNKVPKEVKTHLGYASKCHRLISLLFLHYVSWQEANKHSVLFITNFFMQLISDVWCFFKSKGWLKCKQFNFLFSFMTTIFKYKQKFKKVSRLVLCSIILE